MIGPDPGHGPENCRLSLVTAELGPDGSIGYKVMGVCANQPITGQLKYATNHQMAERFFYKGAEIITSAICQADPWITEIACEEPKVSAKGADPGPLMNHSIPLSRHVVNSSAAFHHAWANAARPKPPGPPVNAQAIIRSYNNRATITWLSPDEQGNNGPYLDFVVEARPQHAEGVAWRKLGGVARRPAPDVRPDYLLTVNLPPLVPGTTRWELRACSTTVLARTCTSPMLPTLAPGGERDHRPGKSVDQLLLPPKRLPGTIQKPSPGSNAALNPLPLPPKALPGTIPKPSPGSNPALDPQPPKFGFGSIMRRGIPEGDAPSTDAAADDAPHANAPSLEEKPTP